jgi:hypothetical protein
MPSNTYRTASSSVAPLKAGGFLEVRRGDLRGAKITDKRTWATQEEWLAAVGEPLVSAPIKPTFLTPDLEIVHANRGFTTSMYYYNGSHEQAKLSYIAERLSEAARWAKVPGGAPVLDFVIRLGAEIDATKKRIAYCQREGFAGHTFATKNISRFYVQSETGMHAVYYDAKRNLIGVSDNYNPIFKKVVLKTGHSFSELGITPKGYWRKNILGNLEPVV